MAKEDLKKKLLKKLLKFQRNGLLKYREYLDKQLIYSSKSAKRKAYKKYIEEQIVANDKRLEKLNKKS